MNIITNVPLASATPLCLRANLSCVRGNNGGSLISNGGVACSLGCLRVPTILGCGCSMSSRFSVRPRFNNCFTINMNNGVGGFTRQRTRDSFHDSGFHHLSNNLHVNYNVNCSVFCTSLACSVNLTGVYRSDFSGSRGKTLLLGFKIGFW